jgi:hypothetical protein
MMRKLFALLLLLNALSAKDRKPSAPWPGGCGAEAGVLCVRNLWWDYVRNSDIKGTFENNSTGTITTLQLTFVLKSGGVIVGSATASGFVPIQPHERWEIVAPYASNTSRVGLDTLDSISVYVCATVPQMLDLEPKRGCINDTIKLDPPLFAPGGYFTKRSWEKAHGYR